jgi:hypothetical protein
MNKSNLSRFLEIITQSKLPKIQFDTLLLNCSNIFNNQIDYANKFWEENCDDEPTDANEKLKRLNAYSKASLLIYELTFNDFDFSPIAWGEDTQTVHNDILHLLNNEDYSDYPEDKNFNLSEYTEFIKNEMLKNYSEFELYQFSEYLPSEEDSLVFFIIHKNDIVEFENLKIEIGMSAQKI